MDLKNWIILSPLNSSSNQIINLSNFNHSNSNKMSLKHADTVGGLFSNLEELKKDNLNTILQIKQGMFGHEFDL